MGKSRERRESVIEKRREMTDRCGKKVEGSESVFKKGRELEKYIYYIYFLNAEGNPITYQLYNGPLYVGPVDFITPKNSIKSWLSNGPTPIKFYSAIAEL